MPQLRVFYSDRLTIPLPPGHRFPIAKYRMLRETLVASGVLREDEIYASPLATREDAVLAHSESYVDGIISGTIDPMIIKRIGFPWTEGLVARSFATVGGCVSAARSALENGISGNLAGGTHHAHRDAGEGYCVFNDIAVSFLRLKADGLIRKAAIIDLDVHQGNGNSSILGGRDDIFIFSMHGAKNYPFRKIPSTLDLNLADGTGDAEYLALLREHLPSVLDFNPDIVFYQAGVDPLREDVLGKLSLTHDGLMERDRLVLDACRQRLIPVSISMGGGYANPIELTVQAHVGTYRVVREIFPFL
jgi:acetoin utilization deacetylase AcuC-like enzyme